MNSKLLYAATIAIALLGSGAAMATEATQFLAPASTLTRAEVKAELARAQAAGELNRPSAQFGSAEPAKASVRTRAEVRSEAIQAARDHSFNPLYVGA